MGVAKKKRKKTAKKKDAGVLVDGLGPKDIKRIRSAVRRAWGWSVSRRLALKRALDAEGFYKCELCSKRAPKVQVDHITPVGEVDGGFIERLFCPSSKLQVLCIRCHRFKTKLNREGF